MQRGRTSTRSNSGLRVRGRSSTFSAASAVPNDRCDLRGWITSRTSQGLFWVLTLGHCSVYMLGPSAFPRFASFVFFVWVTGAPLAIMTVLEVCIRVSVQAGPVWRLRSWRRMMIPLFHQLEALALCAMAYRGGMSIYLLFVALGGAVMPTATSDQDKATVLVLCAYRVLRTWGDYHGVSVQSTLRFRRREKLRNKPWMDEYKSQLAAHGELFFPRAQRCFDRRCTQMALLLATILYGLMEYQDSYPVTSEIFGYVLLAAFFAEFLARTKAQGGEHFFRPLYNKLETCVLALGTFCLFYGSWYTEYLAQEKNQRAAVATATVVLLLLHRCVRMLGIRFQVQADDFHANSLTSAKAVELFLKKFGDLVEVPPTNIHVDVPGSMVHIQKATLKPEAFTDLHLPMTVTGGLIEDLLVDFFTPESHTSPFARVRTQGSTKVRIKNLLLVLGAGRGLAEAGGSRGSYWHVEQVLEAKARVVDLLFKRVSAPFPEPRGPVSGESLPTGSSKRWGGRRIGFAQRLRMKLGVVLNSGMRRFRNLLKDSALRHLDLHIQNASLQFQDSDGALGLGCVSLGLKVDSLKCTRHAQRRASLELARLSLSAEAYAREESWPQKSINTEKPQEVVRRMVRLTRAERLRSWGFAELRSKRKGAAERLRHLERWPERHQLLTIPWVCLHGGPDVTATAENRQSQQSAGRRLAGALKMVRRKVMRKAEAGDIEDQLFNEGREEADRWHWNLQVRPVSVIVDDVQLACVRHLHHCVRSWIAWDAALRFRPAVTPMHFLVTSRERRAVVRCWWLYALHRVVAERRGRRSKIWFLDLVLKAGYRFKYRSLLAAVVEKSGPLIPGGRVNLKPSPQQKTQMQELQMHLPYADILSCLRAVLREAMSDAAPEQDLEEDDDEEEEEEEEEVAEVQEDADQESVSSDSDAEPSGSGLWELCWDGLEVWVPFWRRKGYRPVLLHVDMRELKVEGEVLEKEAKEDRFAPFSFVGSLKSFHVSSPECSKVYPACLEVMKITQPLRMAPNIFDAFVPPEGELALVVQALSTSSKVVQVKVHCPELQVLVWEPLLLTLRAMLLPHQRTEMALLHGGTVAYDGGAMLARNGRLGPQRVTASFEAFRGGPSRTAAALLARRLEAGKRFFERWAAVREDVSLDVTLNLRSMRIYQMGSFSKDLAGVEELRVLPQRLRWRVARGGKCSLGAEGSQRPPAPSWTPGSQEECGVRRETPVEAPPVSGWQWPQLCCATPVEPRHVVLAEPMERLPLHGEAVMQLAFWTIRPGELQDWLEDSQREVRRCYL